LIQILYIGGYETTSHMIGNGLVALLTHPAQLAALLAAPDRMRNAVDEMLRFDGPISLTQVVAAEGAELGGRPAEARATYIGLLGAANHDPAAFDHPELFDNRPPSKAQRVFRRGRSFLSGRRLGEAGTRNGVRRTHQTLSDHESSPTRRRFGFSRFPPARLSSGFASART